MACVVTGASSARESWRWRHDTLVLMQAEGHEEARTEPSTDEAVADAAQSAELFFARAPVSHAEPDMKAIFQAQGQVCPVLDPAQLQKVTHLGCMCVQQPGT